MPKMEARMSSGMRNEVVILAAASRCTLQTRRETDRETLGDV